MNEEYDIEELERMRRRKARIQRMKREKERRIRMQKMILRLIPAACAVLVLVIVLTAALVRAAVRADKAPKEEEQKVVSDENREPSAGLEDVSAASAGDAADADTQNVFVPTVSTRQYAASPSERTAAPPAEVESTNVIFLNKNTGEILAQRDARTVLSPASMTKVLTLLVAAEHIYSLDDTFTMTIDITDYSYSHDCSSVGFAVGEKVTVRDLLYGTVLPSGGDAAVGLATYVAGSHEAFVDLMNEKAEILGLSDTAHFTNCVGLYDEQHHCTAYDMAMIMEAALDNELCREVLGAHIYTTSQTPEHPDGITVSNWFLRRIEDKDTGGEVVCAKTGFVVQSRSCAVSYGTDGEQNEFICVTTGAQSSWKCIYDHVRLYKKYANSSLL